MQLHKHLKMHVQSSKENDIQIEFLVSFRRVELIYIFLERRDAVICIQHAYSQERAFHTIYGRPGIYMTEERFRRDVFVRTYGISESEHRELQGGFHCWHDKEHTEDFLIQGQGGDEYHWCGASRLRCWWGRR